jgi:integrase
LTVNGKRKIKYGKTQREVRNWLLETRKALSDNTYVDNDMTVSEFFEIYFRDHGKTLRPSTLRSYQNIYIWHIKDTIGNVKLLKLSAVHLNALYTAKKDEGLSNRTVEYINGVLRRAFNQGIKWGLLKFNPTVQASPPKVEKKEMKTWTGNQVKKFFKAVEGERWEAIYYVASLGLREGEILALRWDSIDLANGTLKVVLAVQFVQGKGLIFSEPKSAKSKRRVDLPQYVISALLKHKQKQEILKTSEKWRPNPNQPDNLVFTTNLGTAISPRNLIRHFKEKTKEANLPEIRFHDLRHTTATLLLEKNEHPLVVSSLLGHSSVNLTLSTYSHITPTLAKQAAEKLDEIFGE